MGFFKWPSYAKLIRSQYALSIYKSLLLINKNRNRNSLRNFDAKILNPFMNKDQKKTNRKNESFKRFI